MISFTSLMWGTAIFFALVGALQGWQRQLIGTTAMLLGFFAILQFDSLLRGSLYLLLTNGQIFLLQLCVFSAIVLFAYRNQAVINPESRIGRIRKGLLGAAAGCVNGYFLAGSVWYFLDINRYPFPQLLSAPAEGSASYLGVGSMPAILLGGGLTGSGDLLALAILVLLAIVILIV
ncbi:MAG: hypothetical protein OXT68_04905 [Chloroflexota bacterium]|nr:hypothetical protein [Chloroflexota bacterium]